jgi:hypothetical protein
MIKEEMKYFFPVEFTPKDLKYHLCQKMSKTIFKNYVLHQFKRRVTKLDVLEAVPVMKEQATVDQLQYFQKHRGCCPNIAGAGFIFPKIMAPGGHIILHPIREAKKSWLPLGPIAHRNKADTSIGPSLWLKCTLYFSPTCQKFAP